MLNSNGTLLNGVRSRINKRQNINKINYFNLIKKSEKIHGNKINDKKIVYTDFEIIENIKNNIKNLDNIQLRLHFLLNELAEFDNE